MCDYGWQGSGGITGVCYGCWNHYKAFRREGVLIHNTSRYGEFVCTTPDSKWARELAGELNVSANANTG